MFLKDLQKLEEKYNTRPEFQFRLWRNRFFNIQRIPLGVNFRTYTGGWILKGFYAYALYYLIFVRKPLVPYLNREGYNQYDAGHHTWKAAYYGSG